MNTRTHYSYNKRLQRHASWRRRLAVFFAILLVLAALGGGGYFAYTHFISKKSSKTPVVAEATSATDSQQNKPLKISKSYGIAAGSSLTSLSSSELDSRMHDIAATGAAWVRYDFDWSLIQPDNSRTYSWTQYDKITAAATKYNLQILGIIDYTPAWARNVSCGSAQCAPSHPEQFANFAAAVASHYKSQVHAWEIWNEPNSKDFWKPASSPTDYTLLLKATYAAIKQKDSQAIIITAGLSPQSTNGSAYSPADFLTAVYQAGGKGSFDAVADHPYTFPLSPASTQDHAWRQMIGVKNSLRQIMVTNGDDQKKIWITEFGAPTGGPGPVSTIVNPNLAAKPYVVDESLQAKILDDAIKLYTSYDWAGPLMVYSYKDAGTTTDTNENFFGLVRYNGSHKPAYDVFKLAASK